MSDRLSELAESLEDLVVGLRPDEMTGEVAESCCSSFARIERLSSFAKALCAKRVSDTGRYRHNGSRSGAHWLADKTGESMGAAFRSLETANQAAQVPALDEAGRRGDLSATEAAEVAEATKADPTRTDELIKAARTASLGELRRRCDAIKAAARSEKDAQRAYAAIHAKRYLRSWSESDGAVRLDALLAPLDGARALAAIAAESRHHFEVARRQGRREPAGAYGADALVSLLTGDGGDGPAEPVTTRARAGGGPVSGGAGAERGGGGPGEDDPAGGGPVSGGAGAERGGGGPGEDDPAGGIVQDGAELRGMTAGGESARDGNGRDDGSKDTGELSRGAATGRPAPLADDGETAGGLFELPPPTRPALSPAGRASPGGRPGGTAVPATTASAEKDLDHSCRSDWPSSEATAVPPPADGSRRSKRASSRATVHLRVDLAALKRGRLDEGEVCEIPGVGPVPLATANEVLGDALVHLVVTDGVDVQSVTSLGRSVPSAARVALVERDPVCVVPGCDEARNLEIDHWREPFWKCRSTGLAGLCRICKAHHFLKTHKGFVLTGGPGNWTWLSPDDQRKGPR
jgi:hypothetical protein